MKNFILVILCELLRAINSKESDFTLLNSKIIGGEEVVEGTSSYAVYIKYENVLRAAGALISRTHVLTSAHSVFGLDTSPERFKIIIGSYVLDDYDDDDIYYARNISFHANFSNEQPNLIADLAIITLNRSMFGYAEVIGLSNKIIVPGNAGYVVGWGDIDHLNHTSSKLKKLRVRIIDNLECQNNLQIQIHPSQMCAVSSTIDGGNFFKKDEGGPLVREYRPGFYRVIGIASFSNENPALPGVYTRISSYYNDIRKMKFLNRPELLQVAGNKNSEIGSCSRTKIKIRKTKKKKKPVSKTSSGKAKNRKCTD